jgi:hypothetical protein
VLFQEGRKLIAIEVKSSSTYNPALLKGLKRFAAISPAVAGSYLVYSGDRMAFSGKMTALRYDQVSEIFLP